MGGLFYNGVLKKDCTPPNSSDKVAESCTWGLLNFILGLLIRCTSFLNLWTFKFYLQHWNSEGFFPTCSIPLKMLAGAADDSAMTYMSAWPSPGPLDKTLAKGPCAAPLTRAMCRTQAVAAACCCPCCGSLLSICYHLTESDTTWLNPTEYDRYIKHVNDITWQSLPYVIWHVSDRIWQRLTESVLIFQTGIWHHLTESDTTWQSLTGISNMYLTSPDRVWQVSNRFMTGIWKAFDRTRHHLTDSALIPETCIWYHMT